MNVCVSTIPGCKKKQKKFRDALLNVQEEINKVEETNAEEDHDEMTIEWVRNVTGQSSNGKEATSKATSTSINTAQKTPPPRRPKKPVVIGELVGALETPEEVAQHTDLLTQPATTTTAVARKRMVLPFRKKGKKRRASDVTKASPLKRRAEAAPSTPTKRVSRSQSA